MRTGIQGAQMPRCFLRQSRSQNQRKAGEKQLPKKPAIRGHVEWLSRCNAEHCKSIKLLRHNNFIQRKPNSTVFLVFLFNSLFIGLITDLNKFLLLFGQRNRCVFRRHGQCDQGATEHIGLIHFYRGAAVLFGKNQEAGFAANGA